MKVSCIKGGNVISSLLPWLPLSLAVLYYIANIFVVSTAGNFPLNDDYVYGLAIQHFIKTGEMQLLVCASACYLHVLVGAAICKLAGFSFEILRLMSLTFGLVGLFAVYLILREFKIDRALAGLACCVYAVNPLLVNLEFTYMTDVSALTFCALYQLFFVKGIKQESEKHFAVSGLFLLAAVLVRQSSIVLVVASFIVLVFLSLKKRFSWTVLSMLIVVPLIAAYASDRIMESTVLIAEPYHFQKGGLSRLLQSAFNFPLQGLQVCIIRFGHVLSYLALFCAPLLVGFLAPSVLLRISRTVSLWRGVVFGVIFGGLLYSIFGFGHKMPYCQNLLYLAELGPPSILGHLSGGPPGGGMLLTMGSLILALLFFVAVASGFSRVVKLARHQLAIAPVEDNVDSRDLAVFFCFFVLFLTSAFATMHIMIQNYDRYLLDAFVPALICVTLSVVWLKAKPIWAPALMVIAALGLWSTGMEHCYMSWNRARWQAIRSLEESGVPANKIDGGAEYGFYRDVNIWSAYRTNNRWTFAIESRGRSPQNKKRWWPVLGDDYVVSFVETPGYEVVGDVPFSTWYPWRFDRVLVLKQKTRIDTKSIAADGRQAL